MASYKIGKNFIHLTTYGQKTAINMKNVTHIQLNAKTVNFNFTTPNTTGSNFYFFTHHMKYDAKFTTEEDARELYDKIIEKDN
jgi:hypothetical protein